MILRCCAIVAALMSLAVITSGGPILTLVFSPDGSVLASNGDRRIELRSPRDGALQDTIPCPLSKITSIAFHAGGKILAVAGGTPAVAGEVWLVDWGAKRLISRTTNQTDLATCVAFSPDGTLLGIAGADHVARIWRLAEGGAALSTAFTLTGHAGPVSAIAFSPTGQTIVTGSGDRSIKVWSAEDGRLLRTFNHHTEAVHGLAFRPRRPSDSESPVFCASASDDRTLRVWQPEIGRMVRIVRQHQGPIFAVAFAPDGKSLFSAGKEGMVRRIDAESDTVLMEWPAHEDWTYALAINADGSRLATGDWSGGVRLWDLTAKTPALVRAAE